MTLEICPLGYAEACEFIARFHRHHEPPQGYKFAIGAIDESLALHGVVVVGRPVARNNDNGWTAEVTRLCTDGTKNTCSILYAAAWRAARAMGYRRMGTYILETETGVSLLAAGWKELYKTTGKSWNVPSRPRFDKHPIGQKTFWGVGEIGDWTKDDAS